MSDRQKVLNTVEDLAKRFTYYDRKEDEALPVGAFEELVEADEALLDEVLVKFAGGIGADVDEEPTLIPLLRLVLELLEADENAAEAYDRLHVFWNEDLAAVWRRVAGEEVGGG